MASEWDAITRRLFFPSHFITTYPQIPGPITLSALDLRREECSPNVPHWLIRLMTQRKIVPRSKISEWKGLDRISAMIHEMRCIWREQQKDDIGIDGEVELCQPRDDGEGMVGTGKIIKVQSRSGSRYVTRDTDSTFASPVEEKDLRYWSSLNIPAIYVVYHPDDDRLYWKHVQAYAKTHPTALQPPYRIEFDKTTDTLDASAYAALADLCALAPERVLTDRGETLFANILPVVELPKTIFVAPVLPEKRPNFHDRISGDQFIPPYWYSSGILTTLTDPTIRGTAITNVVDAGGVDRFGLVDWLRVNHENNTVLRALLNSTLHRHLRRIGLNFLKSHRRYFFSEGLTEKTPLKRNWKNSRTGREQERLVAKYYEYGRHKFFRQLALDARFASYGEAWGIVLHPKIHFSTNGVDRWEGKTARSYAISARAEEWNNVYLNNLLFWAHEISGGASKFQLRVSEETVCVISGSPTSLDAGFSIESTPRPKRKAK